jgi:hypothetical protein
MSVTGRASRRSPTTAGLAGTTRTGAGSHDREPPRRSASDGVISDPNARLAVLELTTMTDPATFATRDGTTALADRTGVIPDSCVSHCSTLDPSVHDAPHATGRMTSVVPSAYDRRNARTQDGRHRSKGTYVPPSLTVAASRHPGQRVLVSQPADGRALAPNGWRSRCAGDTSPSETRTSAT